MKRLCECCVIVLLAGCATSPEDASVRRRLDETVIPEISFVRMQLKDVVPELESLSAQHHDSGRVIPIVINFPSRRLDPDSTLITFEASSVSLATAIDVVTEVSRGRWRVDSGVVIIDLDQPEKSMSINILGWETGTKDSAEQPPGR